MQEYKGVNLKKIDKMAGLSFENALRLHFDSIFLFQDESFPSAYFLSCLALEEMGKAFILMDLLWHSLVDGRMEEKHEKYCIKSIYSHYDKQRSFANYFDAWSNPTIFFKELMDGKQEILKQNSTYVGLDKNRKTINLKGKIISPLKISKQKTTKQITEVHNAIVEITHMEITEIGDVDSEEVAKLLTKGLFRKLTRDWPFLSLRIKKRIEKFVIT